MMPATIEETIARNKGQPIVFNPGAGFKYSGVGYFILAALIEKVSGQTYETFLRQEVFEPLGMTSTDADQPTLISLDRAPATSARGPSWRMLPTSIRRCSLGVGICTPR